MLECKEHVTRGSKRLVVVAPNVSTARPDTSGISTPDDAPSAKKQPTLPDVSDATAPLTLAQKVAASARMT